MTKISYDPAKRKKTLEERGIDFDHAGAIFEGLYYTFRDERKEYGETRNITVGYLDNRMVVVVWTPRHNGYHIISMRKANDKEKKHYKNHLD